MTATATTSTRSSRSIRRVGSVTHRWGLFAVAVVVWELITRALEDPFFPPPSTIARTAAELWFSGPSSQLGLTDTVFDDILPGLGRMLSAWAVAVVIGVVVGLLLGRSRTGMAYAGTTLNFLRSIPPPLWIAPFLVTVGMDNMPTGTIIFGAVWPILLNTVEGARTVDGTKVETAQAFRLSKAQWIAGVVLPSALPKIFAGLRLSLSMAVILMVVSELQNSSYGIGFQLVSAQFDYELPAMWAWILLLSVLGYTFNTVLLIGERRALRWQNTLGGTA